ncbi:hypothetical protein MPTK1_2g24060 [Marchantia polymorpha subsp. ruderalis]|uniref:Uncharacterized protein n=1 Tax=Marchantia polymorpha TaxID=3197 RepID=A0A2R6WPF0_MARPO|nr:hypothetical protein MARPO_0069s0055 [Marchantia polymorpha]BBN03510.1 hypothetical protein Mp_2g24060 [Marchantia polymorpha subsp. ruderalis]|eukprot:PTQ35716.1 hypothetical protein MARPO_0069s0055 [Marchantia polymorpha]
MIDKWSAIAVCGALEHTVLLLRHYGHSLPATVAGSEFSHRPPEGRHGGRAGATRQTQMDPERARNRRRQAMGRTSRQRSNFTISSEIACGSHLAWDSGMRECGTVCICFLRSSGAASYSSQALHGHGHNCETKWPQGR